MAKFDLSKYIFLFLDRDGVINEERLNDYVKNMTEFIFTEDAVRAINILTNGFDKTFIITNQRGIGRGKMSHEQLNSVHEYMLNEISKHSGKIDGIYFCQDIHDNSINRKPNTGMAFKIQADNPELEFDRTIMVGNSKSDIIFGNKLGMYTILVGNKYPSGHPIYELADNYFESLSKFAEFYKTEKEK